MPVLGFWTSFRSLNVWNSLVCKEIRPCAREHHTGTAIENHAQRFWEPWPKATPRQRFGCHAGSCKSAGYCRVSHAMERQSFWWGVSHGLQFVWGTLSEFVQNIFVFPQTKESENACHQTATHMESAWKNTQLQKRHSQTTIHPQNPSCNMPSGQLDSKFRTAAQNETFYPRKFSNTGVKLVGSIGTNFQMERQQTNDQLLLFMWKSHQFWRWNSTHKDR